MLFNRPLHFVLECHGDSCIVVHCRFRGGETGGGTVYPFGGGVGYTSGTLMHGAPPDASVLDTSGPVCVGFWALGFGGSSRGVSLNPKP